MSRKKFDSGARYVLIVLFILFIIIGAEIIEGLLRWLLI